MRPALNKAAQEGSHPRDGAPGPFSPLTRSGAEGTGQVPCLCTWTPRSRPRSGPHACHTRNTSDDTPGCLFFCFISSCSRQELTVRLYLFSCTTKSCLCKSFKDRFSVQTRGHQEVIRPPAARWEQPSLVCGCKDTTFLRHSKLLRHFFAKKLHRERHTI